MYLHFRKPPVYLYLGEILCGFDQSNLVHARFEGGEMVRVTQNGGAERLKHRADETENQEGTRRSKERRLSHQEEPG